MISMALLCVAVAALIGPRPHDHFRFRSVFVTSRVVAARDLRRWAAPGVATVVAGAALTGSIGLVAATSVVGAVGMWLIHRGLGDRAALASEEALLHAMSVVVAELSVGSPTALACARASSEILADDQSSGVGTDLAILAARVQLGGDVDTSDAGSVQRISALWSASARYGLPLGELLVASRADLVARHRFVSHTRAALAGPRASARVLAGLPLLGLILGEAIGANPLHVLGSSGMGSLLLVAGTVLAAVGVVWSERIVDQVLS